MKTLILNCLDNDNNIKLSYFLDSFIDDLHKRNNSVNCVQIKDLEIKPCFCCTAQYSFRYEKKCRCDDDMNNLFPLFRESDNWIFFANLSDKGAKDYLKNVLDRMEPLFQPISFYENGMGLESGLGNKMTGNLMLVAVTTGASDEFVHNISSHFDTFSMLFNKKFAGTILIDNSTKQNDVDNEVRNIASLLCEPDEKTISAEL